ncbi:MlaE family ABC transporter permease [Thermosulfurimonas dismutans]|uniref:ABC transporter permease n=1 Tax=Thermosulfurimonas dismutans TaxID=999894 RepID=A0A179D2I4_9BACT|nr:ABC transporter permease [Thermosulfurimonas dismutans]OAQ20280.1 ABC transporter permease [Thermosulfurimonas dismutans]
MLNFLSYLGRVGLDFISQAGGMALLFLTTLVYTFRPPFRLRLFFKQMEFVGVNSLLVVVLTALFSGMVMAFQGYHALSKFGGESLLGGLVALSLVRELGPVLTSLMVTARAGSAMAAELGSMRVTEQIDALEVMAVNPVHYLVVPRFWAAVIMVPLLTIIADLVGIAGGYLVGVMLLNVDAGIFIRKMQEMVEWLDLSSGIYKAFVFGGLLSIIGCYKGYNASGGAEGVGRATTEAVVIASVSILVGDYILTSLLF